MAKKKNFKNIKDLENVVGLLNEVEEALKDVSKTFFNSKFFNSPAPEFIAGLGGFGVGAAAAAAFKAAAAGSVGGGAILKALAALGLGSAKVGLFTVGGIIAIPVGIAVAFMALFKRNKFKKEKLRLYQLAIQRHNTLIQELNDKANVSENRIEYLQTLIVLLKKTIVAFQEDLEIKTDDSLTTI